MNMLYAAAIFRAQLMETIAIQVDQDVAKAYREAAPAEQLKIRRCIIKI
jgi:hypothetical protein